MGDVEKITRDRVIQFRMEQSGYDALESVANELGTTVSNLAREIVYKDLYAAFFRGVKQNGGKVTPGVSRDQAKHIVLQKYKYRIGPHKSTKR